MLKKQPLIPMCFDKNMTVIKFFVNNLIVACKGHDYVQKQTFQTASLI